MTAACTTALITPGRGEVDGQDLVMDGTGMRERDESRVASRFFLTWDAWPGMLSSSAVHFQKLSSLVPARPRQCRALYSAMYIQTMILFHSPDIKSLHLLPHCPGAFHTMQGNVPSVVLEPSLAIPLPHWEWLQERKDQEAQRQAALGSGPGSFSCDGVIGQVALTA